MSHPDSLQEITVTAQRRAESIQNVPITIQAITGEQLQQLNVATLRRCRQVPAERHLRLQRPWSGQHLHARPDRRLRRRQSVEREHPAVPERRHVPGRPVGAVPGRNLDIYMADMERIEVLEGPQGTLFGGGAEAGAIRYITNKPKLDKTEGNVEAMYGITAHGDPNQSSRPC